MEGLLHELVKESDNLESILRSRVPKGSDFALQWTLNRVVKKKVEHVAEVIENVIDRLHVILSAREDVVEGEIITTQDLAVQTLHNMQRKIDYSLSLAGHSGVAVQFKAPGDKLTLYQRLADMNKLSISTDHNPTVTNICRRGPNFTWLFKPDIRAIHKLSNTEAISYSPKHIQLAATYTCRGLSFKDCLEYVKFCKGWYEEGKPIILSPYGDEIDAMERVYSGQDDAWGYEIKRSVKATLLKISEPAPLRALKRAPGGFASHKALTDDPVQLIDSKAALLEFISHILTQEPLHQGQLPTVAIDVEFSAKASYRGQVPLIQVSTHQTDYIVDPLAINDYQAMHQFNQITANPGILKVMHGIDHDVEWLQQDFGIFFVNVFDTFRAAKELRTPGGFSLYNLVLLYGQIALDKSQQMSDWRVRPLTVAQLQYAREDTRYLLHVFGRMRNQILSMTREPHQWTSKSTTIDKTTHLGRKVLLNVLHASHQVAAKVVNWGPLNIDAKLDRLHEISSGRVPITIGLRSSAEVLFALRDLLARDRNEPPLAICAEVPLYQAIIQSLDAPHALKKNLPRVPSDIAQLLQNALAECASTFENRDQCYTGREDPSKKRLRSVELNEVNDDKPTASIPAVPGEAVKRRKLLMTEVDKIKSESADDGAISEINDLALDGSGDMYDDIEVVIKGFYQAGAGKVACFEKKGNQTSKSIKELGGQPPWLCVLDSTILSRV